MYGVTHPDDTHSDDSNSPDTREPDGATEPWARTRNVYAVPFTSPVAVAVDPPVASWSVSQQASPSMQPSDRYCTAYPTVPTSPRAADATHDNTTRLSPGAATRSVGAPGNAYVDTWTLDSSPGPTSLTATTVTS